MQTGRLLQAVAIMLLVAMAASCAVSKDYSSRIFRPRVLNEHSPDTAITALHFLDIDTAEADKANWVSTDAIMGRDTSNGTTALDNFSKTFPAVKKDSIKVSSDKEPVKNTGPVILAETKLPLKKDDPVARSYDNSPVRLKKSRDQQ
ncbi:MAG: hypothetical protein IPQ08_04430 [Chitinophagaceae bacterium]|nr:hypothetical protein [Chitinophagaceae bacterium]